MHNDASNYDADVTVDTDEQRVDGHTFERGYDLHDIGEAHCRQWLADIGLSVESWGIDMRDDQHVLGDDKMDLKAYETVLDDDRIVPAALRALVEVKVKSNDEWFGIINKHHFIKYLLQVHAHDVPAFIYMTVADEDDESITQETWIPIQEWDELQRVLDGSYDYYEPSAADQFLDDQIETHPQVDYIFRAPDGNIVVELDTDTGYTRAEVAAMLADETPTVAAATEVSDA